MKKAKDMSGGELAVCLTGAIAAMFTLEVFWWWVAQHTSWWLFALLTTAATMAWLTVTSTRKVLRERRRRARLAAQPARDLVEQFDDPSITGYERRPR